LFFSTNSLLIFLGLPLSEESFFQMFTTEGQKYRKLRSRELSF